MASIRDSRLLFVRQKETTRLKILWSIRIEFLAQRCVETYQLPGEHEWGQA
jgi:hypothetical protein